MPLPHRAAVPELLDLQEERMTPSERDELSGLGVVRQFRNL